jgi:SpoVK/Ycf46/Vps4 family AAA+-type ATPase
MSVDETGRETPPDGETARCRALIAALARLDERLRAAVRAAQAVFGAAAATDPFRGLHISDDDAQALLARQPLSLELVVAEPAEPSSDDPLAWLAQKFGLSALEADVVLIALAPEFDLRYERVYAYLQDDVTRRRPTVDLVLTLLSPPGEARLRMRTLFAPDRPLLRHGLVELVGDANQIQPPLLSLYVKLDDQIVRALLGQEDVDPRLARFTTLVEPAEDAPPTWLPAEILQAIPAFAAAGAEAPARLYFRGAPGAGKRAAAEAMASAVGAPLLTLDAGRIGEAADLDETFARFFREARLKAAVPYLCGLDALRAPEARARWTALQAALLRHDGRVILSGRDPWTSAVRTGVTITSVGFDMPSYAARRSSWEAGLARCGAKPSERDLDRLAGSFRLNPGQIAAALDTATHQARWRGTHAGEHAEDAVPTIDDVFEAARAETGHELARLARRIVPRYSWDDLVLPPDAAAQLREVCDQAYYRHVVYESWGFDRKLSLGKGLHVLFSGPPGTGKTMAAEVIAREIGVELFKIDLSQVVNKYIGETEKNLDRIFAVAENSNAILLFDEADALFGKRSEVRDAHDRYANIEISYLLQKMEEYQGVSILATNLRQNMDDAFVRRLHAIIEFPFPSEESRRRIWERVFPAEAPVADDVVFGRLAREIALPGGSIKNMALAAAFYGAADEGVISEAHLIHAAHREYQKLARSWDGMSAEGGGS